MVANVLDRYYLAITLLITLGYQCIGFAIAFTLKFDKITDFTGGTNFIILALVTMLMSNTFYARNIVASVLSMVHGAYLAGFLLYRVLKRGSDSRFDEFRGNFVKFGAFWLFQLIWVWTCSLPVTILNSPAVSDLSEGGNNPSFGKGADIVGLIFFAVGMIMEIVADFQKTQWKNTNPPRDAPNTYGIWKYSRHPNYAGEIILWWGIWVLCLTPARHGNLSPSGRHALDLAVFSPLFTMANIALLGGLPTSERPGAKKYYLQTYGRYATPETRNAWANYKTYINRTSILWPVSPSLYEKLPQIIKIVFFWDLPQYRFNEAKDGQEALAEEDRLDRKDRETQHLVE